MQLFAKLRSEYGISIEALSFGSRFTGLNRPGSDVDKCLQVLSYGSVPKVHALLGALGLRDETCWMPDADVKNSNLHLHHAAVVLRLLHSLLKANMIAGIIVMSSILL